MSNMSYCRFENTSNDLEDCKVALEDMLHGNNEEDGIPMVLSRSELQFAQLLVVSCLDIVRLIAEEACIEAEDLDEMNVEEKLRNAIFSANEGAQKEKEDVEMEREEAEERQEAMKKTAEQATAAKEPTTTVERPTFVTDTMLRFLGALGSDVRVEGHPVRCSLRNERARVRGRRNRAAPEDAARSRKEDDGR